MQHLCGWKSRPDDVLQVLATKINPTFGDAAPHLRDYYQGETIGLWEAAKKVNNGQHLPADLQTIGDCESHGNGRAVDYLYCVKQSQGVASGFIEGQTSCMTEALYGEGREVGNDLGTQDGACGIWMVQALQKFGFVGRKGRSYDGNLAKRYGHTGTPQDLKDEGRIHILTDYAQLKSTDDMANALKAGCPCPISSSQGFSMSRDSNGICRASGRWDHCMVVIGCFMVSSRRNFVILQSWGQDCPDGPMPYQGPDNSFGCDELAMQRIIAYGDSYALQAFQGWQAPQKLDWVM